MGEGEPLAPLSDSSSEEQGLAGSSSSSSRSSSLGQGLGSKGETLINLEQRLGNKGEALSSLEEGLRNKGEALRSLEEGQGNGGETLGTAMECGTGGSPFASSHHALSPTSNMAGCTGCGEADPGLSKLAGTAGGISSSYGHTRPAAVLNNLQLMRCYRQGITGGAS
jgi:hypothetical protein